jgi:CubicO group peptidase (beta-lactamase class C family)
MVDRFGHHVPTVPAGARRRAPRGRRQYVARVSSLVADVDRLAGEQRFSGAVRVDIAGRVDVAAAYGLAHRGHGVPNRVDTRFAIASGTKGFTATTVVSLVADGTLALTTTARSLLGDDLPLVPNDVTVEHLLAHRSGIGDYLDEDTDLDVNDHLLTVAPHELAATEQYLAVLDGFSPKFTAGTAFSYCNSGYVVLALLAERATGTPFPQLVHDRVCAPAGMTATEFVRSDELDGSVATGYLAREGDGDRTNVFHLPVQGSGDGGIFTTVADTHRFWAAFDAGRIVPERWAHEMTAPRSTAADGHRYGLGFWLRPERDVVFLTGSDAGVSFHSVHDRERDVTSTVVSNTTDGAWPIARRLDALVR